MGIEVYITAIEKSEFDEWKNLFKVSPLAKNRLDLWDITDEFKHEEVEINSRSSSNEFLAFFRDKNEYMNCSNATYCEANKKNRCDDCSKVRIIKIEDMEEFIDIVENRKPYEDEDIYEFDEIYLKNIKRFLNAVDVDKEMIIYRVSS